MAYIQGTVRLFDDTALPDITVEAYDNTGALVLTAITDGSGDYSLSPVPVVPGDYWLRFTDPTGFYLDKWYRNHSSYEAAFADTAAKIHVTTDTTVLDVIINPVVGNPQPQGPYGEVEYGSAWRLSPTRYPGAYEEFKYTSTIIATPVDYGRMAVSWTAPAGEWDAVTVVRSFAGCPITPDEGVALGEWVRGQEVLSFQDAGLIEGAFVYYSVFVHALDPGRERWVRAGQVEALVTKDHGWVRKLWEWLPWHYHVRDNELAPPPALSNDVFSLNINATSGTVEVTITSPRGTGVASFSYDSSAAVIQAQLEALPSVGEGNVKVTVDEQKTQSYDSGVFYRIELCGALAGASDVSFFGAALTAGGG